MNNSKLKNRIIIGSANFTQNYGIGLTKIRYSEIQKILKLAKQNNIYEIDTAEGYLKNKIVFKNIDKKFQLSTKIIPNHKWISLEFCQKKLENHSKNFNGNKIKTLFFHDIKILLSKNGLKIFKNLEVLKKKKYFQKIGISIYDPDCLNYLVTNYNFNVVQCPYNILDKRILSTKWFDKLKKLNIEIHIRSVFLQGLLVNKLIHKKKYFKKWQEKITKWFTWLENNNFSPIDYCLNDLSQHDFDKIIIGIDNHEHLKKIINYKKINKNKMQNFTTNDTRLIDPRNWK